MGSKWGLRVKFDEESIGDGLEAQKILFFSAGVFSRAFATALTFYFNLEFD